MKHILVCDDEPHVVEGIRFLLRDSNRHIDAATNGREALEAIERAIPDLLITDITMPVMSGLELVAALRAVPATQQLPIIILTARGQPRGGVMTHENWGVLEIGKPFEPRKLREIVSSILESAVCPPSTFI